LNTWAEASIAGKPTGWPYLSAADSARFLLNLTTTTYTTPNVFAVIKGTKKPNEAVVLSAHSDHIGRNFFDIYNGADDDGTGTAALLVMAKAFQEATKAGKGPERTLIFAHFTAEEKGLLGSNYYAEHPIWPMKSTFVNVNVDMIGRTDFKHQAQDRYVYSIGSEKLKPALKQLNEKVNQDCCQIDLDYFYDRPDDTEHLYERSDHYNFAKNGVPVIFYFSGLHPDYHGVNDDVSRIEWQKFEDRSKLIYNLVWQLTRKRTSLD
jgi:Zn-dependent M28 family amino/carboxypeptidase